MTYKLGRALLLTLTAIGATSAIWSFWWRVYAAMQILADMHLLAWVGEFLLFCVWVMTLRLSWKYTFKPILIDTINWLGR